MSFCWKNHHSFHTIYRHSSPDLSHNFVFCKNSRFIIKEFVILLLKSCFLNVRKEKNGLLFKQRYLNFFKYFKKPYLIFSKPSLSYGKKETVFEKVILGLWTFSGTPLKKGEGGNCPSRPALCRGGDKNCSVKQRKNALLRWKCASFSDIAPPPTL